MHLGLASAAIEQDDQKRRKTLEKMICGIQRYQKYAGTRPQLRRPCVWQTGSTQLLKIQQGAEDKTPVLLVPSLVNRSTILDLNETNSFAQWLADQGFAVHLLDWGDICDEDVPPDLETLITERIGGALSFLQKQYEQKVHLFGYCMGGTLCMAAANLYPNALRSLTLLAAPWDMHADDNMLYKRTTFWAGSAIPAIQEKNMLPPEWLQSLFASLDPGATIRKFSAFADMPDNCKEESVFIAVEDWLNDGVRLPASVAQSCIVDWFLKNKPYAGEWHVKGHRIDAGSIQCPALVVASKRDRLVAYGCAVAAYYGMPHAELITPDCGHIGMMAGRNAKAQVWEPLAEWMRQK